MLKKMQFRHQSNKELAKNPIFRTQLFLFFTENREMDITSGMCLQIDE